jgi:hypothetical protein
VTVAKAPCCIDKTSWGRMQKRVTVVLILGILFIGMEEKQVDCSKKERFALVIEVVITRLIVVVSSLVFRSFFNSRDSHRDQMAHLVVVFNAWPFGSRLKGNNNIVWCIHHRCDNERNCLWSRSSLLEKSEKNKCLCGHLSVIRPVFASWRLEIFYRHLQRL